MEPKRGEPGDREGNPYESKRVGCCDTLHDQRNGRTSKFIDNKRTELD